MSDHPAQRELAEADSGVQPGHGSETFYVVGEGLLAASRGGRPNGAGAPVTAAAAAAAAAPPFRFSRIGPEGRPAAVPRDPQAPRAGDDGGRQRRRDDPGRLHVPRAVHRPRPDLRQDEGRARDQRVAGRPAPGPLARARPRLAVRRRPRRPEVGALLPVQRPQAQPGQDGRGRHRPARRQGGLRPAAAQRREARDRPRRPQRREPRGGADAPRDDALPQPGRRRARLGAGGQALPPGAGGGRQALPVDGPPRLPAADLRPGGGRRRVRQRPQGVRGGRPGDPGPDDADRVLDRRVPPRPQHDPALLQLERGVRRRRRDARLPVQLLGHERVPRRGVAAAVATGSPTGGGCTPSTRPR